MPRPGRVVRITGSARAASGWRTCVRAITCGAIGCVLAVWSAGARADPTLSIAIAPQPLETALAEFAQQTGLQLVYVSDTILDQRSRGSQAGLPASEALSELLAGTGLTFQFLNERAVRIFPGPSRSERSTRSKSAADGEAILAARSLDEIDVIGKRYNEHVSALEVVQSVPASVSMVSGDVLEAQGSEQLLDYAADIPGLSVSPSGGPGQSIVWVRGVLPFTDAASLAFYLDDVPVGGTGQWAYANALSLDLLPHDLERLEVWRGPEGTFYGADSEIGLIKYALKQPNLSELEATVSAEVSTIHGAARPGESLWGAVNVPLADGRLALRVSGNDSYAPGYIDNLYNGATGINALRRRDGRVALRWQPAEALSVTVNALWQRIVVASVSEVTFDRVGVVPNTGEAYFVESLGSWGDLLDNEAFLSPEHKTLDFYSVSLNWMPGPFEMHSATGWSRIYADWSIDATQMYGSFYPAWSNDKVPVGLATSGEILTLEKFSEEFRINSPQRAHIEWMLGAFYTREGATNDQYSEAYDQSYRPIPFFAPYLNFSHEPSTFKEEVIFGDVTWHALRRFDLAAGIRLGHDEQSFDLQSGAWNSLASAYGGADSETHASGSASASYHLAPSVMVYARAATGFQPGSPNGNQPAVPLNVKGETVDNYEVGLKAQSADHQALMDLSLFYVNWNDIQVFASEYSANFLVNGARATTKGFELTTTYAPIPGLELGYNAAYTESALDSTSPFADYIVNGYPVPNVPKWSLSARADYAWPLTGEWRARLGGDGRWIGQEFSADGAVQNRSLDNYPAVVLPSYTVVDLNARASKGPLTVRFFARNLLDKRAFLQSFPLVSASGVPSLMVNKLLQPRTLGVGFDYRFSR